MQTKRQPDLISGTSGFVLERTARLMKLALQQRLNQSGAGVTVDQWVLMQEIRQQPGISQLDLAKATCKDAPNVTRILDLLTQKGLLVRIPDLADRRKYCLELTPAGEQVYQQTFPLIVDFRKTVWSGLSQDDMDHLLRILDQIALNIASGKGVSS